MKEALRGTRGKPASGRLTSGSRIDVDDLSVTYRRPDGKSLLAVNGVDVTVRDGEFVTLIGPSGCGKTSLLRAMGGLVTPSSGRVVLDGEPVTRPMPDKVAYIFQDFALFPWRTALANVEIALELKGVGRREREERARDALAAVHLEDAADCYPRELSGGMQQRVAVARALASDADVLLLDEPFGSLDEQTRLSLGMQLSELLEASGKTIVFVTHSLQEAAFLSDRIVVFSGRPCTTKKVLEVDLPRPRHPSQVTSSTSVEIQTELFQLLYQGPSTER